MRPPSQQAEAGTAYRLKEMMVVRFEGGANRTIKQGCHKIELNRKVCQIQNRLAELGQGNEKRVESLLGDGHVT